MAASVWLINEGDVRLALLRWLLIVLTTGLIINSQESLYLKTITIGSILCSIASYSSVYFQSFLICRQNEVIAPPLLTGVNLCAESGLFIGILVLFLVIISSLGITLSAMCRPLTVAAISGLPRYAEKAKSIEKNLRAIFISIAAILVMLKIISVA